MTTDAAPMSLAQVEPTLRAPMRRIPSVNLEDPLILRLAALASRLVPAERVDEVTTSTVRVGDIGLRLYRPAQLSCAGLVWIHGGGLVIGAARTDDRLCGETARDTGATVVSVDYRLAPRHPFPVPLDDCHSGWAWLIRHASQLGVDPSRIAIGGQSAGGGLAAALAQRLHDEGHEVAAQWLWCPMLDDRTAADRALDGVGHFLWNNRSNLVGWSSYLAQAPGAPSLPPYAAAARRADLSGLPPTWIYWSDIELFADECRAYARRLVEAGVAVEAIEIAGAPHGFEGWARDTDLARSLVARGRSWLADALA